MKLLTSDHKAEKLKESQRFEKQLPEDFIKDPYVFEFLMIIKA